MLVSIIFSLSLFASPNIEEIKAALQANPSLLETPQAKAAMAARKFSTLDVKSKIDLTDEPIINDINISITNETNETNETVLFNPFAYKSSEQILKELRENQLHLVEKKLTRYSSRFFANKNLINPSSIPTPDDYIVSNGDTLIIYVYGDRDVTYTPIVNNDGTIELPYLGPISVGGMKFKDVKKHLKHNLKKHFKLSDFYINMQKYSTIQVTLVGDVKAPGLYNLASFSTLKDLLIASKGLNSTASVREILIKRNGKTIKKVDFYDLLFKANKVATTILKQGDIVVVKQAKKLVSVDGYIKNAAIFELSGNETLETLLIYAGGLQANASKTNIKIKRFINNKESQTLKISYDEAKNFKMLDGDSVYIYPLDFSAQKSINVYGNVIRPGSYNLPKEKTLNAFFKKNIKESKKQFFLPKTYFKYGVIKRYNEDLKYETISFNLLDIFKNKTTVFLEAQDEIFIFSQDDIFTNSYVITSGKNLLHPGKLQYYSGMTIEDALHASGIDGIIDDKVEVTTFNTSDFMPQTRFYSLKTQGKTKLSAYDEIRVFDYYDLHIIEPVTIKGEVVNPTVAYYEEGMTVADLLKISGGLTHKAYRNSFEIVRYYIDENHTRQRKILQFNPQDMPYSRIALHPYDVVTIFTIPNWSENKTVTLKGEVKFPGTYTIETGEKLSSVIERAGGFTDEAFIRGAVFTRESIRQKQMKQYNQTLARIKRQLAIFNAMPANAKAVTPGSDSLSSLNEVMEEAKKYQPIGRVSIKLDADIQKIKESEYDLVLQDKDMLIIPSHIDTVTVFGEVFNPTSFVYQSDKSVAEYIEMASGFSRVADKESVYIIHADGTSEPAVSGWGIFKTYATIEKGDTIVVPIYIKEYSQLSLWESISKIMASFAITAATLNTLGVF
jgi:protein involved in polysaccharide export with SLBB domain